MIYKKHTAKDYRKIYAVGDIHGRFDLIQKFIEETGFDKEKDLLISVGDIIDRGKYNLDCLRLINKPWFDMVMGNHEIMAIQSVIYQNNEVKRIWKKENISNNWFDKLTHAQQSEVMVLLSQIQLSCPYVIEIEKDGKKIGIAHANYPSNHYIKDHEIDLDLTVWNTTRYEEAQYNSSYDPVSIFGIDLFIFGHIQVKEPEHHKNCLWIDTGAYRTGVLTFVDIIETFNNVNKPKIIQIK